MISDTSPSQDLVYQGAFQPHFLVSALRHDADRPVLEFSDGSVVTAGDFHNLTSRYGQALARLGVKRGGRVGILSVNRPEVLYITAACLLNEYVLVPLHPIGSLGDHLYVVEDAGVETLVFDPGAFGERADALRSQTKAVRRYLSLGPSLVGEDLDEVAASLTSVPLVAPVLTGSEPYRLYYTGGTTGKPKAIVVLRSNAAPCAQELIALVRDRKGPVQAPKSVDFVSALPLTPVGKPDKKFLRQQYAAASLKEPTANV